MVIGNQITIVRDEKTRAGAAVLESENSGVMWLIFVNWLGAGGFEPPPFAAHLLEQRCTIQSCYAPTILILVWLREEAICSKG